MAHLWGASNGHRWYPRPMCNRYGMSVSCRHRIIFWIKDWSWFLPRQQSHVGPTSVLPSRHWANVSPTYIVVLDFHSQMGIKNWSLVGELLALSNWFFLWRLWRTPTRHTAMKFGPTLPQHWDDSTDFGPTLGQPYLLSGTFANIPDSR